MPRMKTLAVLLILISGLPAMAKDHQQRQGVVAKTYTAMLNDCEVMSPCPKTVVVFDYQGSRYSIYCGDWKGEHDHLFNAGDTINFTEERKVRWKVQVGDKTYPFLLMSVEPIPGQAQE